MIDNTIAAIRTVITEMKESKSEEISIKRSLCKEAEIFLSCRSFSMLDYLSFAENLKAFPVLDVSDIPNDINSKDAIQDRVANHAAALQEYVDRLLKTRIVPYEKIKLNSKRMYGDEVDNLILLFWRVPALLSYAPILTLLALLKGIPRKVFTEEYLTYIDPEKSKISKKEFCAAMTLILNDWYPAQKSDLQRESDYRSTRYRNKKPFYDHKTLQEDFWMMIFFLVLQKELTKYLISKRRKKHPDFDLSAFYEDFLSLWPYSPQLFLAIEKDQSKTVDEWNSMLKYFFKSAKPYKKFWRFDTIVKAESFYEIGNKPYVVPTVSFNSKECFAYYASSRTKSNWPATNWLMPGTVYFAAYCFIDDMKVYGMLHHKEWGAEYKKQILNLLLNIRSSWDWVYDEQLSLIADAPNLSEILPFTWEKTTHFDTIDGRTWSETKIKKEIDFMYWEILLGLFRVMTQEHFNEPMPVKVKRINEEGNEISVFPLRMAQYLGLKKTSHET